MVSKGMTTHLIVYKKFVTGNRKGSLAKDATGVDINQLRKSIVSAVKEAKNGLRQHQDLKVQLRFDKTRRHFVLFAKAVRLLESQGFVKRVIVHTKDRVSDRIYNVRCIKFVKDLVDSDEKGGVESDLSDESDFAEIDEDQEGGDGNRVEKGGSGDSQVNVGNAGSSKTVSNQEADNTPDISQIESSALVKIDEDGYLPDQSNRKYILFNQFYPLENQIYDVINSGGAFGIPAMDLCNNLVGVNYSRTFSRILDTLSDKPANPSKSSGSKKKSIEPPKNLEYLSIIRGIDFSARMKFYRYFSKPGYFSYIGQSPSENWGTWKEINLTDSLRSLWDVEKKLTSPLPGLVEVRMDEHGKSMPLFHGEKGKMGNDTVVISAAPRPVDYSSGKKRGRPRKSQVEDASPGPADSTPKKRGRPKKNGENEVAPKLTKTGKIRKRKSGLPSEAAAVVDDTVALSQESISEQSSEVRGDETIATPVSAQAPTSMTQQSEDIKLEISEEMPSETPMDGIEVTADIDISTSQNVNKELQSDDAIPTQSKSLIKVEVDESTTPTPSIYSTPVPEISSIPSTPSITPNYYPVERQGPTVITPMPGTPAVPSASADVPATASPRATPGKSMSLPRQRSRPKATSSPSNPLSFAFLKRKSQILSLLEDNNGVIEGGGNLQNLMIAKYSQEQGSNIDRKTFQKVVNNMVSKGEINKIMVTVPKGFHITKEILLLPSIDPDCDEVKRVKTNLINGVRKKPAHYVVPKLAEENGDFQYYVLRDIRTRRLAQVDSSKKKGRPTRAKSGGDKTGKDVGGVNKENTTSTVRPPKPIKPKPIKTPKVKSEEPKRRRVSALTSDLMMPVISTPPDVRTPVPNQSTSSTSNIQFLPTYIPNTPSQLGKSPRINPLTNKPQHSRRTRRPGKINVDRFYRVVIIVRSLFSTSLGLIDWDQVVTAFPDLTVEAARSKWPKIRDNYGGSKQIPRAINRWEKLFIKSYQSGELPLIIDEHYDVGFLADFWKSNEGDLDTSNVPWLFDKIEDIESQYSLIDIEADNTKNPFEAFFNSSSMVRTDELMTACPFGVPKHQVPSITPLDKVKQAIKGTIATSHHIYDANISKQILLEHGGEISTKAVKELETDKTIVYLPRDKGKVLPGRNYLFSDKFNGLFQIRLGNGVFHEATEFEKELISTFQSSKGMIMSRAAPDSSLVSILDLICYRKVDLVRINTVTGSLGSGYRSRIVDKDKLDNDIILRAVKSDNELTKLDRPLVPLPLGGPCEYIWTSVRSSLNEDIWAKLIKHALMTIAFRPGISTIAFHNRLSFVLTYEETRQLLHWLCQRGCLRHGDCDSYFIQPRWYSNIFS